jgi:hypothetical protein
LPSEETFCGERRSVILRGIKHHLDHAVYLTVDKRQRTDVDAHPPRYRGSHLNSTQRFTFNGS